MHSKGRASVHSLVNYKLRQQRSMNWRVTLKQRKQNTISMLRGISKILILSRAYLGVSTHVSQQWSFEI
jgi:hypothetical protein